MATKSPTTKPAKGEQPQLPTHDEIRLRAYELSQSTGNGDPVANWLDAERELVEAVTPKPRRRKTAE
jgi:hypothetical protein